MQTDKQVRQRSLFILKGSLHRAKAMISQGIHSPYLSEKSLDDLGEAYGDICHVLNRFNREVGWKKEKHLCQ